MNSFNCEQVAKGHSFHDSTARFLAKYNCRGFSRQELSKLSFRLVALKKCIT